MKIRILAVGRLRDGPERDLIDDYLLRARRLGQTLGWRGVEEVEIADGGGRESEGQRVLQKLGSGRIIRLDERGQALDSVTFSKRLTTWREAASDVDLLIGGADGHAPEVVARAPEAIAFGPATWPHRLVRAMLAEQVYRGLSIAAGSPYHRE